MELQNLPYSFTICKPVRAADIATDAEFVFWARTDRELSLVCQTKDAPADTVERDDGWRGFRVQGVLDLSLVGILSALSGILAEHNIGLFAFSTYDTDTILVKEADFDRAMDALARAGYTIL